VAIVPLSVATEGVSSSILNDLAWLGWLSPEVVADCIHPELVVLAGTERSLTTFTDLVRTPSVFTSATAGLVVGTAASIALVPQSASTAILVPLAPASRAISVTAGLNVSLQKPTESTVALEPTTGVLRTLASGGGESSAALATDADTAVVITVPDVC